MDVCVYMYQYVYMYMIKYNNTSLVLQLSVWRPLVSGINLRIGKERGSQKKDPRDFHKHPCVLQEFHLQQFIEAANRTGKLAT